MRRMIGRGDSHDIARFRKAPARPERIETLGFKIVLPLGTGF